MRKNRLVLGTLATFASALAGGILLLPNLGLGQVGGPLPPPKKPGVTATNGQVGNLQLTPQQETDLVNFLKILTDGYTKSNPVTP